MASQIPRQHFFSGPEGGYCKVCVLYTPEKPNEFFPENQWLDQMVLSY